MSPGERERGRKEKREKKEGGGRPPTFIKLLYF